MKRIRLFFLLFLVPVSYLMTGILVFVVPETLILISGSGRPWVEIAAEAHLALETGLVYSSLTGLVIGLIFSVLNLAGIYIFQPRLRIFLVCTAAVPLAAWAVFRLMPVPESESSKPDVYIIVTDTLRYDYVNAERTPNIHALMRESISSSNAWSESPWTLTSFGSFLTGLHPMEHRAGTGARLGSIGQSLRRDIAYLPEEMKKAGYRTAGLVTNAYLSPGSGMNRGFDYYFNFFGSHFYLSWIGASEMDNEYAPAELQLRRFLMWMKTTAGNENPVFMLLQFMDPHYPYLERPGWMDAEKARRKQSVSEEEIRYGAEVRYMDSVLGKLIEYLRDAGRYENALIVMLSDHGEELSEARAEAAENRWPVNHGHSLYPELLRALFVVKPPGHRDTDFRCQGLITLMDVPATIASIVSLKSWPEESGVSLVNRAGLCMSHRRTVFQGGMLFGPAQHGMRTDRHTVIWKPDRDTWVSYDRKDDPLNLYPLDETTGFHKSLLMEHVRRMNRNRSITPPVRLSEEEIEQLRSLGYMDTEETGVP